MADLYDLWTEKEYQNFILMVDWRQPRKPVPENVPVILPGGSQAKDADGKANLTLWLFDTTIRKIKDRVDIQDVVDLTPETYYPSGCTAMRDAIGTAIDELGQQLAAIQESQRPSKVICMIMTDGMENASKEYEDEDIRRIITTQRNEFSWEFIFLGANIDAPAVAQKIGIPTKRVMQFHATSKGVEVATRGYSRAILSYRNGGLDESNWNQTN